MSADSSPPPGVLHGLRVLHVGTGIAAAYCAKLLADAGADVVLAEPAGGAPLRRDDLGAGEAPLFGYLHASQRAVLADLDDPALAALAARADVLVVQHAGTPAVDTLALARRHPQLIVAVVSPYGVAAAGGGELAAAPGPATDLTVQALSGSLGGRGETGAAPVAAGGRLTEWAAGIVAAVCVLVALRRRIATGYGEHVDVSLLDTAVTIYNGFRTIAVQVAGGVPAGPARVVEVPSTEPAADGWVGFSTNTATHFASFARMVGHEEWVADPQLSRADVRTHRSAELRPAIAEWTGAHPVAEILAEAAGRHIPCAPVPDGASLPAVDQFAARGVFVPGPDGGLQPRVPYRLGAVPPPPFRPAPAPGCVEPDAVAAEWAAPHRFDPPRPGGDAGSAPLADLRVFDFTSFWAGPIVGQVLAGFGADVLKVESTSRPDGTRLSTAYAVSTDRPWECAPVYLGSNTGKRCVTLDLTTDRGRELAGALLERCDVLVENYTPKVAERFGLLDAERADRIVVRMPAWGLDGPWRDRPGFAQNVEQASGLATVTGQPDGRPLVPRGPCDPIGGLHAAFATLLAVLHRDRTGQGQRIEATLVEPAVNVAGEQVVEHSRRGRLLGRIGNRSRTEAPQGVYRCAGEDSWLALTVTDADGWAGLRRLLGDPPALAGAELDDVAGRQQAHDAIDAAVGAWCTHRSVEAAVAELRAAGVAVAPVVSPYHVAEVDLLRRRGYFERVPHAVLGSVELPGFPARFASRPGAFHTRPAPTLGEHNAEVLGGLLGVGAAELDELAAAGVIGTEPRPARVTQ